MQPVRIIRNRIAGTTQTDALRAAYNSIDRIDPCGEACRELCQFLDDRTDLELQELAQAQIKWVSGLARNRCFRRGIEDYPNATNPLKKTAPRF